jgi:ABC-type oligopeptide transport system ATPase subunit
MNQPLLRIENLDVTYGSGKRAFTAVRDVSLTIDPGETLSVVGESGSGKSSVGRAILGLTKPTGGKIIFDGQDITDVSRRTRQRLSADLQVVFQDPRSSLNEAKKVGQILIEPLVANHRLKRSAAIDRAEELLEQVGLDTGALNQLPGSFSGGQKQRIAIARALMARPKLIVCDEPVSALDLSVQAQITNLFRKIQADTGVSYLFIAHDLSVVRLLSQRIAVMSRGQVVEHGETEEVYTNPRELYTKRLLAAEPYPDPVIQRERRRAWDALTDDASSAA